MFFIYSAPDGWRIFCSWSIMIFPRHISDLGTLQVAFFVLFRTQGVPCATTRTMDLLFCWRNKNTINFIHTWFPYGPVAACTTYSEKWLCWDLTRKFSSTLQNAHFTCSQAWICLTSELYPEKFKQMLESLQLTKACNANENTFKVMKDKMFWQTMPFN